MNTPTAITNTILIIASMLITGLAGAAFLSATEFVGGYLVA